MPAHSREPLLINSELHYPNVKVILFDDLPGLDTRTFSHESAMLVEAYGSLPPCKSLRQCRGMLDHALITNLSKPIILMASMSLDTLLEYGTNAEHAIETLINSNEPPLEIYDYCVLCHRYNQKKLIISARKTTLFDYECSPIDKMVNEIMIKRIQPIQSFVCPVDVHDGYRSEWMMYPQPSDPFFYPIVDPPLSVMRAKAEGRYFIIEQTALAFDALPILEPKPGERISDFIIRVSVTDGYDYEKHSVLKRARITFFTLTFSPLRKSWTDTWWQWSFDKKYIPVVNHLGSVNYTQLKYIVNHPELDMCNDYYLNACRLVDCFARGELDLKMVTSWSTFVPQWHSTVNNLSYWTSLSRVSNPLLHQLSKSALKQRCQTRNARDMITKRMVSRELTDQNVFVYDATLFMMCKDLLLCTLLGNYRDRPRAGSLNVDERHEMILFFQGPTSRRWIMNLFLQCPSVLNVCIRDFVGDQWKHRPALCEVIQDFVKPDEYIASNNLLIQKIRKIIMDHHSVEWRALPSNECSLSRMWMCGLKDCQFPCKHVLLHPNKIRQLQKKTKTMEDMMDQAYEIMEPRFEDDIAWTRPTECSQVYADEQDEAESRWTWTATEMHNELNRLDYSDHDRYRRRFLHSRDIFRSSKDLVCEQIDLSAYDPRNAECLNMIVRDQIKNDTVSQLFEDFKTRKINLSNAKIAWTEVDPAIQLRIKHIDWNIQKAQKRPQIIAVSKNLGIRQLNAVRQYHGALVGGLHCCIVYCRTCNAVKTPIDYHKHGLEHVKVSFVTKDVFCAKCDDPLIWYNMIGKVFVMNQSFHAICSKCGFLSKNPVMRDDLVCSMCSVTKRPAIEVNWRANARNGTCAITHCHRNTNNVRNGHLTEMSACWLYSKDDQHVFVCSRHYRSDFLNAIKSESCEEVIQKINVMCRRRKPRGSK